MNRFIKLFLTGLLAGFFMTATAGPPPGGQVRTIPFQAYCHPEENKMITALMTSFGQHVSMTADGADGALKIYVFENPEEKTLSILATSLDSFPQESCLILNGTNIEHLVRPDVMPPRDGEEA